MSFKLKSKNVMAEIVSSDYDRIPVRKCEDCVYYGMIDSGYGYCRRFPPRLLQTKYLPIRYEAKYPEVPWCECACGEFHKER